MKKILLVDLDDTPFPNLALMKLSAFHKRRGNQVTFNFFIGNYDEVFASCVFSKNAYKIGELPFDCLCMGGSGINLQEKLDSDIEKSMPDYSLYGKDFSLGFITRGCSRKCPFCLIPAKEGMIHLASDISEFLSPRFDKVVLLDNNILSYPEHELVLRELIDRHLKVSFCQGFDIRLINETNAQILSELQSYNWKFRRQTYYFAFDDIKLEKVVLEGIKILGKAGVKPARLMFYVLTGYNSSIEEDLYRVNILMDLGVDVFVMLHDGASHHDRTRREFQMWANMPRFRKSVPFDKWADFRSRRGQQTVTSERRVE